jgi:Tfp pilus assembly protein PilO
VSRTYRILIVAIVAVLAVGGYWKLALAPKRVEAAALEQKVAVQQAQLAQTQALIATYQGARAAYEANYDTVVRLGKAVPADDDTRSLVVQLDAAAKRSGVNFDAINTTASGAGTSSDAANTKIVPGAVNAGAFSAMPFSFSFSGDFDTLGNFFSRLERFVSLDGDKIAVSGRLLRVENISVQPSDKGWPSMTALIGASSYMVPAATPAATGAAPPVATTTAATATAPPAATAPTTTSSAGSNLR